MQNRRIGCWVCWKRKLKCDSRFPNSCANCAKRGVECRYESCSTDQKLLGRVIPSRQLTEAGIPRDRAQRACSNCATQKLKCSGDPEGCERCCQNDLNCQYPISKRGSKRLSRPRQAAKVQNAMDIAKITNFEQPIVDSTADHSKSSNNQVNADNVPQLTDDQSLGALCTKAIIRRHVDAYFEHVYPVTTHGFLHQGTLLQELDEERASVTLLKAIAVSSSRFVSSTAEVSKQTTQWMNDVDTFIMNSMGVFSILNLQVLTLWTNHHYSCGNFGKTWMLLGLAARLAYCLHINSESKVGSTSEIESRRRIMWNLRIMDRLLAGTFKEFSVCSTYMDDLLLPCSEHFFLAEIAVETETLQAFTKKDQLKNIGGFAGFVGLLDIWREILLFMKKLSLSEDVDIVVPQASRLHRKLEDFEESLPPNLKFVNRNLYLHSNSPQKITFIMLQSWWHECHCDLYRFSLPGFRESLNMAMQPSAFAEYCHAQVLQSARAQSNLWKLALNTGGFLVSDPTITVLVHSNTKTLLAIQKLMDIGGWYGHDRDMEDGEIPTLLTSNLSVLEGLGSRMPRIAAAHREIQKLISSSGVHGSAEAIINDGLPLRRRHSREELVVEKLGADAQTQSLSQTIHPIAATYITASTNEQRKIISSISIDVFNKNSGKDVPGECDIYLNTPVSLEGEALAATETSNVSRKHETMELGQNITWKDVEFNLVEMADYMDDFPMLRDQFETAGGVVGCVAPFQLASQYEMLYNTLYIENEEQQNDTDFWTRF